MIFYPAEPIGKIILMNSAQTDYIELVGGSLSNKPLKPILISLSDRGSRKELALHAYSSESSKNAVDAFSRFLHGNTFVRQHIHIRPDNTKGFLNLKHVINNLNDHCKAHINELVFIDDFASPLKPKDKIYLEAQRSFFHDFEDWIITHFESRGAVSGKVQRTRRIDNKVMTIAVTQIDITLDELNASGIAEEYMDNFNSMHHRFSEDGVQIGWIPNSRWYSHLATVAKDERIAFSYHESRSITKKIKTYEEA